MVEAASLPMSGSDGCNGNSVDRKYILRVLTKGLTTMMSESEDVAFDSWY